jgi:hypothetical protein
MICLEKISANICLLGCSHAFHDYCIVPWFAWQEINATQDTQNTEFSCCACRAPVKYCTHGPMESPDPCNPTENNKRKWNFLCNHSSRTLAGVMSELCEHMRNNEKRLSQRIQELQDERQAFALQYGAEHGSLQLSAIHIQQDEKDSLEAFMTALQQTMVFPTAALVQTVRRVEHPQPRRSAPPPPPTPPPPPPPSSFQRFVRSRQLPESH